MKPLRDSLRNELRLKRDALTPRERLAAAEGVAERLAELPELLTDQRIAGYWAVRGEIALHRVLPDLVVRGQQFHLPVIVSGNALRFAPWSPGDAVDPNRFGIPEPRVGSEQLLDPQLMELVLVPMLGFDRRGHRLGSGAGYYDRSFAFLREGERPREPLLVGIAHAFQEIPVLPDAAWDVRMDFICTERELIECKPGSG